MAPFLDVGSIAFDNPDHYGYKLRARTFEEPRERMILPSWKHIMNYESTYMSNDEMVEATYDAALDLNRIKGEHGILDRNGRRRGRASARHASKCAGWTTCSTTERDASTRAWRRLKEEFERLSETPLRRRAS